MLQKSKTVKIPGSPASKSNGDSSISEEGGGSPGRVGWGGVGAGTRKEQVLSMRGEGAMVTLACEQHSDTQQPWSPSLYIY